MALWFCILLGIVSQAGNQGERYPAHVQSSTPSPSRTNSSVSRINTKILAQAFAGALHPAPQVAVSTPPPSTPPSSPLRLTKANTAKMLAQAFAGAMHPAPQVAVSTPTALALPSPAAPRLTKATTAKRLAQAFAGALDFFPQSTGDEKNAALLLCFLFSIIEGLIWLPALRHRDLAINGLPVIATVLECNPVPDPVSHLHQVVVSYSVSNEQRVKAVPVSHQDFSSFSPGSSEIILCNPANPEDFVLYKLCRYHAVLSTQGAQTSP